MASSQTEEVMKSFKSLFAVAALSLSALAAAGGQDVNSVVVRYGDLNLDSQAGVASLHKRIRNAARSVCGPLETRILGLRDAYEACVEAALTDGIAAVGNSNLTQFHASKGRPVVVASN
jgi:UrcA family protein